MTSSPCNFLRSIPLDNACGRKTQFIYFSPQHCVLGCLSPVWLSVTLWTVALQAPLCMRSSRQEYWSGLPWLSPGDLPDPGIEPVSLMSPASGGRFFTTQPPGKLSFISITFWPRILMDFLLNITVALPQALRALIKLLSPSNQR